MCRAADVPSKRKSAECWGLSVTWTMIRYKGGSEYGGMSMTKSFMLLLVVVLALGGAFGGVFAGGVAFGKTQGGEIALPQEANPLASNSRTSPIVVA